MANKRTNEQTMIYKILHRKLQIEHYEPHLINGELRCSTSDTRRACHC